MIIFGDRKPWDHRAVKQVFDQLDLENFLALKEIQIDDIRWPTCEQEAREDQWIPPSELLHRKGIKVYDKKGVAGSTGARVGRR